MSPIGGYRVMMPPTRGRYHTYEWDKKERKRTDCGVIATVWWRTVTEYQAAIQYDRHPCGVCRRLKGRPRPVKRRR